MGSAQSGGFKRLHKSRLVAQATSSLKEPMSRSVIGAVNGRGQGGQYDANAHEANETRFSVGIHDSRSSRAAISMEYKLIHGADAVA